MVQRQRSKVVPYTRKKKEATMLFEVCKSSWYQGVVVGTPMMEKEQHRAEEKNLEGIKDKAKDTKVYISLSSMFFLSTSSIGFP
jgi:RNase H-fold protein (predicted Holliday junction resolvase)